MSLKTGLYHIFQVDYTSGNPVSRPLGLSRKDGGPPLVVILPGDIPPPRWYFEARPGDNHVISIEGESVSPVDDTVRALPFLPPFEWLVLPGAPSPPPIGKDAFGITTKEHQSWHFERVEGATEPEIPILISNIADTWHIVPADIEE